MPVAGRSLAPARYRDATRAPIVGGTGPATPGSRSADGPAYGLFASARSGEAVAVEGRDDVRVTETPAADLPVLVIDGATFTDFEGFQRAFSAFLNDHEWHGNLDAFNDILRGGFGTPESGWILRWLNSDLSREALGYDATVKHLEPLLSTCHRSNISRMGQRIETARRRDGPTLFAQIIEIIRIHGPGGEEEEDGVLLELL